ncbi:hypothetical protein C9I86_08455 [Photobacterium sp. NCIMB 13483]|nr:hypothetical protein C9I86_08455 [Photobacterium sp. NCIMB 13483]
MLNRFLFIFIGKFVLRQFSSQIDEFYFLLSWLGFIIDAYLIIIFFVFFRIKNNEKIGHNIA